MGFDFNEGRPSNRDLTEDIADLLSDGESLRVSELAAELGETGRTVRRNLREMEADGLVDLIRGNGENWRARKSND